jgi:hypothetical protein
VTTSFAPRIESEVLSGLHDGLFSDEIEDLPPWPGETSSLFESAPSVASTRREDLQRAFVLVDWLVRRAAPATFAGVIPWADDLRAAWPVVDTLSAFAAHELALCLVPPLRHRGRVWSRFGDELEQTLGALVWADAAVAAGLHHADHPLAGQARRSARAMSFSDPADDGSLERVGHGAGITLRWARACSTGGGAPDLVSGLALVVIRLVG